MTTLYFVLALVAVVCFAVAAFLREDATVRRFDSVFFIGAGLGLWALIDVIRLGRGM